MMLKQAAETLGVPSSTITGWLKHELVVPPGYTCTQRVPLELGPKELRELAIIRDLRAAGVSCQAIRRAARLLRELGCNPFSEGQFLAVERGKEIIRVVGTGEATALLGQPGQLVLALPKDPLQGADVHTSELTADRARD